MLRIKEQFKAGKISKLEAAKLLTAHNGNGLANNLTIVKRWN